MLKMLDERISGFCEEMMALTVFAVRSNLVDMKDKPGTLNREKKFPGKKNVPCF